MRRVTIATLMSLIAMPALAEEDIVLRGMGSFHIGGRIAEVSGKPVREIVRQPGGPLTKLDPNGGWKGRGLWSSSGDRTPWLIEGGKGRKPMAVHFQVRPDPLAK